MWECPYHLHLKEKNHSFEGNSEKILSREDGWFEKGIKEFTSNWSDLLVTEELTKTSQISTPTHGLKPCDCPPGS